MAKTKVAREVQWWLATLDQHGNATLSDGAHSDRSGVLRAMELTKKLASTDNFTGRVVTPLHPHGYAIARVELEPIS